MGISDPFLVMGRSGKMRIQTLPPRRTYRVITRRAASICLDVTHACPPARNPKFPYATVFVRLAIPLFGRRGLCHFLCLTFLGNNIIGMFNAQCAKNAEHHELYEN